MNEPETVHCSTWTWDEAIDPAGTAGSYRTVLLVERPLPWPNDVSEIAGLERAVTLDPRTRILAVVPRSDGSAGLTRVVRWHRDDAGPFVGTDYVVPSPDLVDFLAALIDDARAVGGAAVGPAPRDVLLCAHGRRDRCCGRLGTLLAAGIAGKSSATRTWRCSHTGGHRFAPTGLTFPDGRAWAHLDTDLLGRILDRTVEWAELRHHHRGSLALDPFAQVAEGRALERLGWTWAAVAPRVDTIVNDDGRSAAVTLAWSTDTHTATAVADVVVARDIPVVICGRSAVEWKKTEPEYAVTALDVSVHELPALV